MEFSKIISVTGLSGLYELISSRPDGAVVRSLEDNSTKFAATRQHNFSHLESIEIFTLKENITLADVFSAMKNSKTKKPEPKAANGDIKKYFEKLDLGLDFEKVYTSDMKKMLKWHDILEKNKIDFTQKSEEQEADDTLSEKSRKQSSNSPVKGMKPQQANPRKIESRGVK